MRLFIPVLTTTVIKADTTVYMYFDNKKRNRNNGPIDERRGAEAGMRDVTEVSIAYWV